MNTKSAGATALQELDRATLLHPFTELKPFAAGEGSQPCIIAGGEGIRIRDQNGSELIDAFAGIYCNLIGYGRREIADAMHEQALKLAYYHSFRGYSNEPAIRLGAHLLTMEPGRMQRIQFGLSGSDASEFANCWTVSALVFPEKLAASRIGPFAPGPKPLAMRS